MKRKSIGGDGGGDAITKLAEETTEKSDEVTEVTTAFAETEGAVTVTVLKNRSSSNSNSINISSSSDKLDRVSLRDMRPVYHRWWIRKSVKKFVNTAKESPQ